MNYNVSSYKKSEIETNENDPIKLVIMLYEGAINFAEQAKLRMRENKMADKGVLISKVLAIIGELQSSLNLKQGGEVAVNMDRIYSYLRDRLMEANSDNSEELLSEVSQHLRVLKNAWTQARDKQNEAVAPKIEQISKESGTKAEIKKSSSFASLAQQSGHQQNALQPALEILG